MSEPENKSTKNQETLKVLIIILVLITAAAVGTTIWALFFRNRVPEVSPDYAPQQVEANAERIDDDDTLKLEQSDGGGAVSLTYSNKVTLTLSSKEAALMFQNPAKSNQDMKLELEIDGKVIAASGKLEPGYKISTLSDVDTDKLSEGTYEGKFVVSYYDTASGEKAILNTEIPIVITVKN